MRSINFLKVLEEAVMHKMGLLAGLIAVAISGPAATSSLMAEGTGIKNPSLPAQATHAVAHSPGAAKVKVKVKKKTTRQHSPSLKVAAKKLFGHERRPADMAPSSIGFYSKGCLAGAKMLPPTGKFWQAMRLSRNRNWGHPALVALIEKLAKDAHEKDQWNGLLVGDLTQPRGGPMLSGHKSHQIGLDADVWLREMPKRVMSRQEREKFQPISMLKNALSVDDKKFTRKIFALIRRAASYREVARIGVNPAIKHALCKMAGGDKPWLAKIQSWPGHHYHMHIRIKCPAGSRSCRGQGRPGGTSCAASRKWYRNAKAWADLPAAEKKRRTARANKKRKKRKPKPQITLAGLPSACRTVLTAQARDKIEHVVVLPMKKPATPPVATAPAAPASTVVPAPTLARRQ